MSDFRQSCRFSEGLHSHLCYLATWLVTTWLLGLNLMGLSQLLREWMQPKCRASEEIRDLFYKCSHGKSARTKARTI